MNRIAIAFSTKDRTELSLRSIEPLLQPDKFDLFISDGSDTAAAQALPYHYPKAIVSSNVRGGADAAIVFNLTHMLNHPNAYEYVGLVENDVLLHPDWFGPTMALFRRGHDDGLRVGAVSARAYEDRILCQRDGYALMHNIGAGMIVLTRDAASLLLQYFRTSWTLENRQVFCQLTDLDLARWWAFGASDHWITADWGFEKVLAAHGYASLALTPSPCGMIGQVPPLADQGLRLVEKPVELLRNDVAFKKFVARTARLRETEWSLPRNLYDRPISPDGTHLIFAHHAPTAAGTYSGDWKLRWQQGFGPFGWEARDATARLDIDLYGSVAFLVSGGQQGGRVRVRDQQSGYEITPELGPAAHAPGMTTLPVPAQTSYRTLTLEALSPGVLFHGIQTRDAQAYCPWTRFDHSVLPAV